VGQRADCNPPPTGALSLFHDVRSDCNPCNPPPTGALSLFHNVRSLLPRKESSACPPLKSLGVTNKGESGFGKANDRVKAKKHRPYWILGGSAVGYPRSRREKARPSFEGHYRVPSLSPKRSSQVLRPARPPKPISNQYKK
jgi:hypothetical protein